MYPVQETYKVNKQSNTKVFKSRFFNVVTYIKELFY